MTKEEKVILGTKYYTLNQCSKEMGGISTQTLRTRIKEGKLKAYKFTNEFLVKPSDLEAYINSVASFNPEKGDKPKKMAIKAVKTTKKSVSKSKPKKKVKTLKKSAKKGR